MNLSLRNPGFLILQNWTEAVEAVLHFQPEWRGVGGWE